MAQEGNIVEYKCPCCSGAISFDPGTQKMVCPFCNTELDVQTVIDFNQENEDMAGESSFEWDDYGKEKDSWGSDEGLAVYTCSSCAGELIADSSTQATICPYCGSPVILSGNLSGVYKPDYVIPFKLGKEQAKAGLEKFLKGKILLPAEFKDTNRIESIDPFYVPFWLFDCMADAKIRYRGTKVRTWSDSRYHYTKTSFYSILRSGSLSFEKVPADGSTKMDDKYTQSVEPFDYSDLVDFQMPYLAGYKAEKYDVTPKEAIPIVNNRIRTSTEQTFSSTVRGYNTVRVDSSKINLITGKTRYALLPMWILTTKYNDKSYMFAMNAQTGKFVGELPVSKKKAAGLFFGFAAAFGAVLTAIALILGSL